LWDAMPCSLSEIYPKDGDGKFFQNIPEFQSDCMAPSTRLMLIVTLKSLT